MKKILKPQRTQKAQRIAVCGPNWQFVLLIMQSMLAPPHPIPVRVPVRPTPALPVLKKKSRGG